MCQTQRSKAFIFTLSSILSLSSTFVTAHAQDELEIKADNVNSDIKARTLVYRDNVELRYRTLTIYADRISYGLEGKGTVVIVGSPLKAIIKHSKFKSDGTLTVEARLGRIEKPYQTAYFKDNVVIIEGENRISADELKVDIKNQTYEGKNIQIKIPDLNSIRDRGKK